MKDLTKQTESILLHKLNALEEAINYTHSCTELPSKQKSCVNGIDSDTCRHNSVCDYC